MDDHQVNGHRGVDAPRPLPGNPAIVGRQSVRPVILRPRLSVG